MNAGVFFVTADIDLWSQFCDISYGAFVEKYRNSFVKFLAKRRGACEKQYVEYNRANRLARIGQIAASRSCTSSSSSIVVQSKKGNNVRKGLARMSIVRTKAKGTGAGNSGSKKKPKKMMILPCIIKLGSGLLIDMLLISF